MIIKKKKLYLIVFIACIGLISEGVFCLIQLDRVYTAANYANVNTVPSIITIDNLSDTIARLRISTWQHVKQRDPALMAEIERTITDLRADADRFLKEYDTYLTDDTDRHLLNQIRAALLQYDGIRQ
jgi:nitrogen fixation/metabolism regulation signal transduction histidine kinase